MGLGRCTPNPSFFFFQAEDGIRDDLVTGVQTCALPISGRTLELATIVLFVGAIQMSQAVVSGLVNEAQSAHKEPRVVHQRINKVAVLGAGTMGARIAAHLANAGTPCYLLDIIPPDAAQSTDRAARNKS